MANKKLSTKKRIKIVVIETMINLTIFVRLFTNKIKLEMIKKFITLSALILSTTMAVNAGGVLTNTNQSARFARLFALDGYTKGADIAYYNPAATIKLKEGLHFTLTNQSVWQKRIINSTFAPYADSPLKQGTKEFIGTASAPIVPSVQGVYKKDNWALSGSIAVVGGGGKATFNDGISMFESQIAILPGTINGLASQVGIPVTASAYNYNTHMSGSNFIYGGQIGGAYEVNEMWSFYGGLRLNIVSNKYEGYVSDIQFNPKASVPQYEAILGDGSMVSASEYLKNLLDSPLAAELSPEIKGMLEEKSKELGDRHLNSKQSGWGVAPIIGVNFTYENLNIGAKYEFKTTLNVENKTKLNQDAGLEQFKNGVNTAHDIPALFTIGAQYKIIEPLTVLLSYHHFFDKDAKMTNDKQKALKRGTNEYLAGVEYSVTPMFALSMGGQITRYGLADDFQTDLSFYCNSFSLGFGGSVNISENTQINAGYFFTKYDRYHMAKTQEMQPVNIYDRTNRVFTVGVDFSF